MSLPDSNEFCVIGSGPSAVSAAVALARRNLRITIVDAGCSLEPERSAAVSRMAQTSPPEWHLGDLALIKEGFASTANGIPLKRLYGSEFPFHRPKTSFDLETEKVGIKPSFASGGLSTVWGAGILPFHPNDIADWPLEAHDLDEHYRAVFSFMPSVGCSDDLEELFPNFSTSQQDLKPSAQARVLLNDIARVRGRLRRHGVFIGQSRLAVDADGTSYGRRSCEYCGLCLYGCPYEIIYNSEFTLRHLKRLPNVRYEADFIVEELRENSGEVRILGRNRATGEPRELVAGRVLLGAGVIPSTAIILKSLNEYNAPVRIQDSTYFLLPLIRFKGTKNLDSEQLHTLAQLFIVIRDPSICEQLVFLSVYTYNDLMISSLKAAGGRFGAYGDRLWRALGARTLICGGFLHSRLSPGMWLTLEHTATGGSRVRLQAEESAQTAALVRKIGIKLLKETFAVRAFPLIPAIQKAQAGRGFHAGGSFPMSHERTSHTSDLEGRPFGFERVHLVDASCLPSIPATTVTLPVMANAHRIATLAANRGL